MPPADAVAIAIGAATRRDPAFGLFVRMAATIGARRGELCAIRWSAVDLTAATVCIEASSYSERRGPVVIKDTKNHSKRVASLDPATCDALGEQLRRMQTRVAACGVALRDDAFVFSNEADGSQPWRPDYPTGAWTLLRKEVGLDGVRLHDLRHFHATMLLQNGIPVKDVSRRIGHRDAATTLNVYAHVLETTDRRAADVIGSVLAGPAAAAAGRRSGGSGPQ